MKILAAAFFCLMGFAVTASAQEFTYAKGPSQQEILNDLIGSAKYRPKQVATLESFDLPLIIEGKEAGSVTVKAGTALKLVSVKPDGVIVEVHGNQKKLAVDKTDLLARYPDRKKEVDKEFEEERQALLAASLLPLNLPPPFYVPEPEKVTEVVYIDTSRPRRENSGNYWPYTGGYYPSYSSLRP